MVKQVQADGGVFLRGRLGEGRGDALVPGPQPEVRQAGSGRVKGTAEVKP